MGRKILLNLFLISFNLLISPVCKSQDSCLLLKKEIKTAIYKLFPGNDKIYKDSIASFFIVDIKMDKINQSVTSTDYFYKNSLTSFIAQNKKQLDSLFKIKWKNNCPVDRVLIPIFILPVFDDAVVEDYPIDLYPGLRKSKGEEYLQYIFDLVVIVINKAVK